MAYFYDKCSRLNFQFFVKSLTFNKFSSLQDNSTIYTILNNININLNY